VTVVRAEPKDGPGLSGDEDGALTEVFAGALDNETACAKMAESVAAQENEARNSIVEEGEELPEQLTPMDIRLNWTFHVLSMPITP
jgi:hypothetical protein